MAVTGSERMVLRMVKVLKKATKNQIADKMGVSPDYAEYLCQADGNWWLPEPSGGGLSK